MKSILGKKSRIEIRMKGKHGMEALKSRERTHEQKKKRSKQAEWMEKREWEENEE